MGVWKARAGGILMHYFCLQAWPGPTMEIHISDTPVWSFTQSSVPHVCPVCGGAGEADSTRYQPLQGTASTITRVTCRSCEGRGIVWAP